MELSVHPDRREVIPLMPEPIIKQDGTEKNDGERNAAKRFMAKLRQDHPHLQFIVTEDGLSSNAPHIETLHDYACHYILGVKEGDHAYLFEQVQVAEQEGRVTHDERRDRGAGIVHQCRFIKPTVSPLLTPVAWPRSRRRPLSATQHHPTTSLVGILWHCN